MIVAGVPLDLGIQGAEMPEAVFAEIAHRLQAAIRQGPEIAHEIWTPVTTSDDPYVYLVSHGVTSGKRSLL
jgi:hypothetical protein